MRNKILGFVFDFLLLIIYALSFFSLLIGYNSGQIRVLLLLFTLAGFLLYILSIHKIFVHAFDKLLRLVRRGVKKLAKILKISKKD